MANVLCVLATARGKGYTAKLLDSVIEGIESVDDVSYEAIQLTRFLPISPCINCWNCFFNEKKRCTLNDSMGKMGEGELFKRVENANALFIAQPVYFMRPPAAVHLFFERFYPFMLTGELNGMPFASLSQAGNNGGARLADFEMSRWVYTWNLKYVGGLPVHLIYFDEARVKARYLGKKIAEAAKVDAEKRENIPQVDRFLGAHGNPYRHLEPFIENLTNGTYEYQDSLIEYALSHGTVKKEDARNHLLKAREELKQTLHYYKLCDNQKAAEHLIKTIASFHPATANEFLMEEAKKYQRA